MIRSSLLVALGVAYCACATRAAASPPAQVRPLPCDSVGDPCASGVVCGFQSDGCRNVDCGVCEDCPASLSARSALRASAPSRLGFVEGVIRDRQGKGVAGGVLVFPGERLLRASADGSFRLGPLAATEQPVRVSAVGYRTRYERLRVYPCRARQNFVLEQDPNAGAHPESGIVRGRVLTPRAGMVAAVELRLLPTTESGFAEQFRATTATGHFELTGLPGDWYRLPARWELHVQGPQLGEYVSTLTPGDGTEELLVDRSKVTAADAGR